MDADFLYFYEAYTVVSLIISMIISIIMIIGFWKIFSKAGKPGWAAIIPIYNLIVLLEVAGRPTWWIIFFLIPGVNVVFYIIVYCFDLAKVFGRGGGFGLGLLFLNFIFILILAFDSSIQYIGPIAGRPAYSEAHGYQVTHQQSQPRSQNNPASSQVYSPPVENSRPQQSYTPPRQTTRSTPPIARVTKAKVPAWLIDSQGHTIQLFEGETTIGKMSENDIQPRDTTVSRRHAKIIERNGHFSILDLGSTNGTKVNGRLIHTLFSLAPDDEIQVGDNTKYHFKS